MDKLTIINRALVSSGNNPIAVANDGSDEGTASEQAFGRALDYLISEHQWPFATDTELLVRTGDAPFEPWRHTMAYPSAAWHLRTVKQQSTGWDIPYLIIGNEIITYEDVNLIAVFVTHPDVGPTWHPSAVEVMTLLVESFLWKGLNDDFEAGENLHNKAIAMLARSAARVDQQSPPRPSYRSRLIIARRARKGSM